MSVETIVAEMIHGAAALESVAAVIPVGPGVTADGVPAPDQLPKTIDELPIQLTRTYELSVSAAAAADIPVVGGVSGGYNRRVVVLERTGYKPFPDGDVTYNYGYAIRLAITISKRTATGKITLPYLAASAEVGEIEAKWILQVVGLAGSKIDEVSLPPTELNVETFVLAKQSLEKLIGAVRDESTVFTALLVSKERDEGTVEDAYARAAAMAYAIGRIEKGRSVNEALRDLRSVTDLIKATVEETYQEFGGIWNPDERPSAELKSRARSLLADIKVEPR